MYIFSLDFIKNNLIIKKPGEDNYTKVEDLNSLKDKFFDVKEKNKDQYANIVDKAETIEKDIVSKYKDIKKEAKEKSGSTKNV